MHELATSSAEAVSLGVRTGNEVTFVKRVETAHVLRTGIREGTSMPLHASACGKALLTGLTDEQIVDLFPEETISYPARGTVIKRADLLAEVHKSRLQGYATSHDEFVDGVSAAAAPVIVGGRVVAAVSIAGPTTRFRADLWIADLQRLVNASELDTSAEGEPA
jgi:DNA-binding IclR family transcriptional regulator